MLLCERSRWPDVRGRGLHFVFHAADDAPFPFIIALNPSLATVAGSSFLSAPTLVSSMSARLKKSVSVAPGIRHVTVTPVSRSSSRSAYENESRNALVPLYTA